MNKDDILIVKTPYRISSKFAKDMCDKLVKQKESGVVILPCNWSVEVAPSDVKIINSADITECARAIKEYCKNKGDDCTDCPFESKNKNACELGRMMLPSEWFLPEPYEKEGE